MKLIDKMLDVLMRLNNQVYCLIGIPVRYWVWRHVPCKYCGHTFSAKLVSFTNRKGVPAHDVRGWCHESNGEYTPNFGGGK